MQDVIDNTLRMRKANFMQLSTELTLTPVISPYSAMMSAPLSYLQLSSINYLPF